MKKYLTIVIIIIILLTAVYFLNQERYTPKLISSFNTLHLGWDNQKDYARMAAILKDFTVIGLLEVMNEDGLEELELAMEKATGRDWSTAISESKVGNSSYKEYYAFLWDTKHAKYRGSRGFYTERCNEFEREPWGADFKIGRFDFTFVLLHSVFGKSVKERKKEAMYLDDVYNYFQEINGAEQDVIIAGDFNLPADDPAFDITDSAGQFYAVPVQPTTIGKDALVSAYDNIFINSSYTTEFSGISGILDFTDNDFAAVRKVVSDHLPVYIEVLTSVEDD